MRSFVRTVSMPPILLVINLAAEVFIFRLGIFHFWFHLLFVKNYTLADVRVRSTLAKSVYVSWNRSVVAYFVGDVYIDTLLVCEPCRERNLCTVVSKLRGGLP
jgi:hypothetical protein